MSEIKARKIQAGISVTPANNFVIDASADDGSFAIKRGSGTEILSAGPAGIVTIDTVTKATDITANRVLKVGDFGVGVIMPGIMDANDAIVPGLYGGPGAGGLNYPGSNTIYGFLRVEGARSSAQLMQVASYIDTQYVRYTADLGVTWTPWRLIYNQGTILGTVSQAAGVPTGAVIERGSNANGAYVKFTDGTMICSFSVNYNATTAASGSIYTSPENTATFPAAFSNIPQCSGNDASSTNIWLAFKSNSTINTTFRSYLPTNVGTTGRTALITAVGSWL